MVLGVNWQLKELSKHAQEASLGVGGRVVDAKKVVFCCGQLGKVVEPAELLLGLFGGLILPYSVLRRSKSELVWTDPSEPRVIIPN